MADLELFQNPRKVDLGCLGWIFCALKKRIATSNLIAKLFISYLNCNYRVGNILNIKW
jgi:hypothetical protein